MCQIMDVRSERESVTFYIADGAGGGFLALEISAPRPDVLGVGLFRGRAVRHDGGLCGTAALPLFTEPQALDADETDAAYVIRAGKMKAVLSKETLTLSFFRSGNLLTQSHCIATQGTSHMCEALSLEVGELVYGLGGQASPLVRNGQRIDDCDTPFYMTSKGFGIFANHPGQVCCGIDCAHPSQVRFSVPGDALTYYIISGENMRAVAAGFCALTRGGTALPSADAFGLRLSVPYVVNYDKGGVAQLVDNMRERGVPISGVERYSILEGGFHPGTGCGSFAEMAQALRAGLSLSLCGTAFWENPIPCIEQPGLFKRLAAFASFSPLPLLRYSKWYSDEQIEALQHFAQVRKSLMPYIFAQAVQSAQGGLPLMRPMFMEYPADTFCQALERQYMLGSSLLAAPVFFEDGHCDVYLPEGTFTNFFTGEVLVGGRILRGKYSYTQMPVFVPENTLLPMRRDGCNDCDLHENVTIGAYRLTEQIAKLYDKSGALRATVIGRSHGEEVTFQVEGDAPGLRFVVHR